MQLKSSCILIVLILSLCIVTIGAGALRGRWGGAYAVKFDLRFEALRHQKSTYWILEDFPDFYNFEIEISPRFFFHPVCFS